MQYIKGRKIYSKHGFTRTVLASGKWGARVSCTNELHDQHKNKQCYLSSIWTNSQVKENGYETTPKKFGCICPKTLYNYWGYLKDCVYHKKDLYIKNKTQYHTE